MFRRRSERIHLVREHLEEEWVNGKGGLSYRLEVNIAPSTPELKLQSPIRRV